MQQSRLVKPKYISIPGTIIQCILNTRSDEKNFVNNKVKLIFTWMFDLNFYHFDQIQRTDLVKTMLKSIFWIIHQTKTSWNLASHHCKISGGHLPSFKCRKDLEKLLAFLKVSIILGQQLGKIFIGLKFYSNKVSCMPFIIQLNSTFI